MKPEQNKICFVNTYRITIASTGNSHRAGRPQTVFYSTTPLFLCNKTGHRISATPHHSCVCVCVFWAVLIRRLHTIVRNWSTHLVQQCTELHTLQCQWLQGNIVYPVFTSKENPVILLSVCTRTITRECVCARERRRYKLISIERDKSPFNCENEIRNYSIVVR